MYRSITLVACVSWLAPTLRAQGTPTFIVDANGGAGAHFTSIQAAVDTVPDGSILLVRPGAYVGATIVGKGVTMLCDPGAALSSGWQNILMIYDTQPSQVVSVRGLGMRSVLIDNCAGPVAIDGTGQTLTALGWWSPISIRGSRQVFVRGCTAPRGASFLRPVPGSRVQDSTVVFEGCRLEGTHGYHNHEVGIVAAAPGIDALRSSVQLVHCAVFGGDASNNIPTAPAVFLDNSSLRALGSSVHPLLGGAWQSAILGSGTARVGPSIPMSGTPPAGPSVVLTRVVMPSLLTVDAPSGGTLVARRFGAAGTPFVIALGRPGPIATLPGIVDPLWFDTLGFSIEAVGVAPATGPFVLQLAVPVQPGLRGTNLVWQSMDLLGGSVFELSNPSPTVIR